MARTGYRSRRSIRYGKPFRTRKGRYGRYKYVNGRKVGFVSARRQSYRKSQYRTRRYYS